jgi:hypothetical protein
VLTTIFIVVTASRWLPGLLGKTWWAYPSMIRQAFQLVIWLGPVVWVPIIILGIRVDELPNELGISPSILLPGLVLIGAGIGVAMFLRPEVDSGDYWSILATLFPALLIPVLMEGVLFRGFAVGLLVGHAGWSWFSSTVLLATLLTLGRQTVGPELESTANFFLHALLVQGFLSWLYLSWGKNLWVSAGFHFLWKCARPVYGTDGPDYFSQAIATILLILVLALIITHSPLNTEPDRRFLAGRFIDRHGRSLKRKTD